MRLHYNNVNGCIYKKKKYKNFIANNNNLLNEIDINTNKFNNICPIGIFISLSGLNYKNQLSTVFNIKEMNNNNYISLFSLFIYDNQPPSVNWTYENNSNINSLDRDEIGLANNVKLGVTIGGSFITKQKLTQWFKYFNSPYSENEFKAFESFMENKKLNYIDFDVEHAWAPEDVSDTTQGMPIQQFVDFINNFSKYCENTQGYFKNNSIYFFIGGDTVLAGNFGGVYSTDTLYKSYNKEYNIIKELLIKANSSQFNGISGIKLLMYCYGAEQPDVNTIVNGGGGTGWINMDIPEDNDLSVFYNNFNLVFYATPNGVGNNNTFTNIQVMQHIKNILNKDNIKKYPLLKGVINNTSIPPFIWTDVDSNLLSGQPKVWENTKPNLFDIMNNYCPSKPKLPSKIDSISIKGEQLLINYSPQ